MVVLRIIRKFSHILSKHQKIRIIELLILVIIGGFMEMLSVSMMVPFIGIIMDPEKYMGYELVKQVMYFFNIQNYRIFLVFLALVMAFFYLIKNIFMVFQCTIQEKFVRGNQFMMKKELMCNFLSRPYEFFMSVKSGEIMRVISSDVTNAFLVLNTLISFLADLTVSLMLITTILFIIPVITLIMGAVLFGVTLLIYGISKPKLERVGERQIKADAEVNQILLQSLQGIKDIKLMRREEYFQNRFNREGKVLVRTQYIGTLLSMIPRFMLEAAAMCGFFIILAVMIYSGEKIETLLPVISGVAMAVVRLLPSMNRISNALANLTYNEPAVDKMIENLVWVNDLHNNQALEEKKSIVKESAQVLPIRDTIIAKNIYYRYPQGKINVLDGACMEIHRGQSIGIVGASGAGKTTAVDLILGLLKPQAGKILIDGIDIELDIDGWLSQLGYIPQTIFMLDGSIRENVAFGIQSEDIDDEKVWKALKEAALDEYVRALPEKLDTQIGERGIRLSGGQRQRIGIARALYTEPEVLFMDEATSALDAETEMAIMESIEYLHGKITMVIIAHRLTTIANCDVIYRVANGKIVRER